MRIDDVPELTLPIIKPNRDYFCQYCDKVCFSRSVICTKSFGDMPLLFIIIYLFDDTRVHCGVQKSSLMKAHALNQTPLQLKFSTVSY